MARLLFWILLGCAAYFALRWWQRRPSAARTASPPRPAALGEDMVPCRVCGLNVPRSEALLEGSRAYCSDDHRQHDDAPG
jgi:uncharacterized protein